MSKVVVIHWSVLSLIPPDYSVTAKNAAWEDSRITIVNLVSWLLLLMEIEIKFGKVTNLDEKAEPTHRWSYGTDC